MNALTARDAGITKFYVVYHDPAVLSAAPTPPDATKLLLSTLPIPEVYQDNAFAEARFLLYAALYMEQVVPRSGYMSLFHASYDTKFAILPSLLRLPSAVAKVLSPTTVITPIAHKQYVTQAEQWHPGITPALTSVLKKSGIPIRHDRPGPLTNSLIAHSDVWRRFLPVYLRAFLFASDEEPVWVSQHGKQGLEYAYLMERITTAWFASQEDLQTRIMALPDGSSYVVADTPEDTMNTNLTINEPCSTR